MLRETKFGYGYCLVGIGLPYLIDKVLGLSAAIVVSVVLVIGGVAFLWSAHRFKEGGYGPKIKFVEVLGITVAFCTLVVLVSIGILKAVPPKETPTTAMNPPAANNGKQDGEIEKNIAELKRELQLLELRRDSRTRKDNLKVDTFQLAKELYELADGHLCNQYSHEPDQYDHCEAIIDYRYRTFFDERVKGIAKRLREKGAKDAELEDKIGMPQYNHAIVNFIAGRLAKDAKESQK